MLQSRTIHRTMKSIFHAGLVLVFGFMSRSASAQQRKESELSGLVTSVTGDPIADVLIVPSSGGFQAWT